MPAGTLQVVKRRIRLALMLIPKKGIYGDIRLVLNDILRMRSRDAKADFARVLNALEGLREWDWADIAWHHLEYAASYFNDEGDQT